MNIQGKNSWNSIKSAKIFQENISFLKNFLRKIKNFCMKHGRQSVVLGKCLGDSEMWMHLGAIHK